MGSAGNFTAAHGSPIAFKIGGDISPTPEKSTHIFKQQAQDLIILWGHKAYEADS